MFYLMYATVLMLGLFDTPKDNSKNLPEKAETETERRGENVEELGTIQGGADAAVNKAMAPPADDSDKWWVNVVLPGEKASVKEKASAKLLLDDIHSLKFKSWVKPNDSANSWAHYQERREDDGMQADWINPIRNRLQVVGLPAVVIQPPANGKYGDHEGFVCIVGQYSGNPEKLSVLIRERVQAYIRKLSREGKLVVETTPVPTPNQIVGHTQSSPVIEARPPFDLPQEVSYPDANALPKEKLTYEQIRAKFPGLPTDVAAEYADKGLSESEIIVLEKQLQEVPKTPGNPTYPATEPDKRTWDLTPYLVAFGLGAVLMLYGPTIAQHIRGSINDNRGGIKGG